MSSGCAYRLRASCAPWRLSTPATCGAEPWSFGPDRVRVDIGPGLRYDTPVGPARLDLGYQLTPIEGLVVDGKPETRRWRIHVSIGQAF